MLIQKVKHLYLELEKKTPNINHAYMITEKVDGWYVYSDYKVGYGWGAIMSSRDRPIPSMEHIYIPSMEHIYGQYPSTLTRPASNCRLIMEAYIPDTEFHVLNGTFNRSIGNYHCDDVHFKVHDIVIPNDCRTAIDRFNSIAHMNLPSIFQQVEILGISNDIEEWKKHFDSIVTNGGEGIVLKQYDGLYCPGKRNSTLMKIKEEVDADLLCIEIYYTLGKKGHDNMNLRLIDKLGIETTVRVGKHSDIALFKEDSHNVIQKVVKIKAMKRIEGGKFREPRFDYVRLDKTKEEID